MPTTMSDGTGPPPFPHNPPASLDLQGPLFSFVTDEWADPPPIVTNKTDEHEITCMRNANDDIYCKLNNPTKWNRYINLGYYAIMEGSMFDLEWFLMSTNPIKMYRIIWYNFLFHVDRDMDIPPLLNEWATKVSQPYLKTHDPASLDMNTLHNRWKDLTFTDTMEIDDNSWTEVRTTSKSRSSPDRHKNIAKAKDSEKSLINTIALTSLNTVASDSTLAHSATEELLNERNAQYEKMSKQKKPKKKALFTSVTPKKVNNAFSTWLQSANLSGNSQAWSKNNDKEPPKTPPPPTSGDTISETDTKQSAVQASSVTTNDGTHRLTFRWSLTKQCYQDFDSNPQRMLENIHHMLQDMFSKKDGYIHQWTSLATPLSIDQLDNPGKVRQYISPNITMIKATHQIVFGVRFCFNQSPIAWKAAEPVTSAMQKFHINVSVSNSTCDSGKLIIAGYLLLKAPNTTHRHRYLQYLQSNLPDTAPFFDIVRLRKTPMDQDILHLGIQCGEKHLTALCQVLSQFLTGHGTALFLPRHIFGAMPEEEIRRHFEFHDNYIKSLRPLPLSPFVSNLDRVRTEYYSDGSTIERTTRQWASSIQTTNGNTSALCDVVNGGPDRKAYLLVPRHYYSDVQHQYRAYKLSLQPIEQREARFRNTIPGLPEVIHITPSMQSNLDFITALSSAEVWSQAPSSVTRQASVTHSYSQSAQYQPSAPVAVQNPGYNVSQSNPMQQEQVHQDDYQRGRRPGNPQSNTSGNTSLASDTRSALTTPSTNKASQASTTMAKFHELEAMIQRQQKTIDNSGKHSTERLATIERQLHRITAIDAKLEDITTGLHKYSESQTTLTNMVQAENKLHAYRLDELSNQIMSTMRSQSELSTSVVDIREHMDQVTAFMHNLSLKLHLDKPTSSPTMQSTESIANPTTLTRYNESGKPNPRTDDQFPPAHKSPRKKKQRSTPLSVSSTSYHHDLLDSDDSDASNPPDIEQVQLHRRFKRLTRLGGKTKLRKRRNSTISKIKKPATKEVQSQATLDDQHTDESDPGSANAS